MRTSWIRDFSWTSAQSWTGLAVQLGLMVILSRFLAPADFGVFAALTAPAALVSAVAALGLGPALVRVGEDKQAPDASTALSLGLITSGLGTAALLSLYSYNPSIVHLLGGTSQMAAIVTISIAFTVIRSVHSGILQRAGQFHMLAVIDIAGLLCNMCVSIALATHGFGAWSLVAGYLFYHAITTALSVISAPIIPTHRLQGVTQLLRFSVPYVCLKLLETAGQTLDRIAIAAVLGPHEVGLYHRSVNIKALSATVALTPVDMLFYPRMARSHHDHSELCKQFNQALTLSASLSIPVTIAAVILAPYWTPVAFGQGWAEVAPYIQITALSLPFLPLERCVAIHARASGHQLSLVPLRAISLAIVLSTTYFLSHYSLMAGIAGAASARAATAVFNTVYAGRRLGIPIKETLRSFLSILALGAAALGAGHGISIATADSLGALTSSAIATIVTSSAFLIILLWLPGPFTSREAALAIKSSLRRLWPRKL